MTQTNTPDTQSFTLSKMHKRTHTKPRILAFAREAGGAAVIAPIVKSMRARKWRVLLFSKDYGTNIFLKKGLTSIPLQKFSSEAIMQKFGKKLPDCIVTSCASLPELDMTERYLWEWGKKNNVPAVAILDQWQNYASRFSGPKGTKRLGYIPDAIFVMDALAQKDMVAEGFCCTKIKVTGQPALDLVRHEHRHAQKLKKRIIDRLRIPAHELIVTFVSESLKKHFKGRLGYDEFSTLDFLGQYLEKLALQKKKKICLCIKLHPQNKRRDFLPYLKRWPGIQKVIIDTNCSPRETIVISDLVIGISSVMLVESLLVGKVTVSLQLNAQIPSQLIATRTGAIPFVRSHAQAKRLISKLIENPFFKKQYLLRQKKWIVPHHAVSHCMHQITSLLKRGNQ